MAQLRGKVFLSIPSVPFRSFGEICGRKIMSHHLPIIFILDFVKQTSYTKPLKF